MKNVLTSSVAYSLLMSIFVIMGVIESFAYGIVIVFFFSCFLIQPFYRNSPMVSFEWKDLFFSLVLTLLSWGVYTVFKQPFTLDAFCSFCLLHFIVVVNLGSLNRYRILF